MENLLKPEKTYRRVRCYSMIRKCQSSEIIIISKSLSPVNSQLRHNLRKSESSSDNYTAVDYSTDEDLIFNISDDDIASSPNIIKKGAYIAAGKRSRSSSLTTLAGQLDRARQLDNYQLFKKLLKQYNNEWENANNNDYFIPPQSYISKVVYDPGCCKIYIKLHDKIINDENGRYKLEIGDLS